MLLRYPSLFWISIYKSVQNSAFATRLSENKLVFLRVPPLFINPCKIPLLQLDYLKISLVFLRVLPLFTESLFHESVQKSAIWKNNLVLLRDPSLFCEITPGNAKIIWDITTLLLLPPAVWGKNPMIPSPEPYNESSEVVLDGPNLTLCEFAYPAAHLASLIRRLLVKINCYQILVS